MKSTTLFAQPITSHFGMLILGSGYNSIILIDIYTIVYINNTVPNMISITKYIYTR